MSTNPPGEEDVLCGRGPQLYNATGNLVLRDLVEDRREQYKSASVKGQKKRIAVGIYQELTLGGSRRRFVKQNDDRTWCELPYNEAIRKIQATFTNKKAQRSAPSIHYLETELEEESRIPISYQDQGEDNDVSMTAAYEDDLQKVQSSCTNTHSLHPVSLRCVKTEQEDHPMFQLDRRRLDDFMAGQQQQQQQQQQQANQQQRKQPSFHRFEGTQPFHPAVLPRRAKTDDRQHPIFQLKHGRHDEFEAYEQQNTPKSLSTSSTTTDSQLLHHPTCARRAKTEEGQHPAFQLEQYGRHDEFHVCKTNTPRISLPSLLTNAQLLSATTRRKTKEEPDQFDVYEQNTNNPIIDQRPVTNTQLLSTTRIKTEEEQDPGHQSPVHRGQEESESYEQDPVNVPPSLVTNTQPCHPSFPTRVKTEGGHHSVFQPEYGRRHHDEYYTFESDNKQDNTLNNNNIGKCHPMFQLEHEWRDDFVSQDDEKNTHYKVQKISTRRPPPPTTTRVRSKSVPIIRLGTEEEEAEEEESRQNKEQVHQGIKQCIPMLMHNDDASHQMQTTETHHHHHELRYLATTSCSLSDNNAAASEEEREPIFSLVEQEPDSDVIKGLVELENYLAKENSFGE